MEAVVAMAGEATAVVQGATDTGPRCPIPPTAPHRCTDPHRGEGAMAMAPPDHPTEEGGASMGTAPREAGEGEATMDDTRWTPFLLIHDIQCIVLI